MDQREFLLKLQKRVHEQEMIMQGMVFPRVFTVVSIWLGDHPWRILIPLAFLVTLVFHFSFGKMYDDVIMRVFGGFGLISLK